jgi:hypothetical protein
MKRNLFCVAFVIFTGAAIVNPNHVLAQTQGRSMEITRQMLNNDNGTPVRLIEAKDARGTRYKVLFSGNVIRELYVNDLKVSAANMADYDDVVGKINEQLDLLQKKEDAQEADRRQGDSLKAKQYAALRAQYVEADEQRKLAGRISDSLKKREYEQLKQQYQQAEEQKKEKRAEESKLKEEKVRVIVGDMVDRHIISNTSELSSFLLTVNTFVVNGKSQSFELYKLFRSKYISSPEEMYSYNYPRGTTIQ